MQEKAQRRGPPLLFLVLVAGITALGFYIMLTNERITDEGGGVLQEDKGVPVSAMRDVRFEINSQERNIAAYDAETGELVEEFILGRNNFFDSLLDVWNRNRRRQGVSEDEPYRVTLMADGRVSFEDPSTGNRIHAVKAFGSENVKPFLRLLRGLSVER